MIAFPDISWIAVNLRGNVASVEFTERQRRPRWCRSTSPKHQGLLSRADHPAGRLQAQAEVKTGTPSYRDSCSSAALWRTNTAAPRWNTPAAWRSPPPDTRCARGGALTQKTLTPTGKVIVRRRATPFRRRAALELRPRSRRKHEREISSRRSPWRGSPLVTPADRAMEEMAGRRSPEQQEAAAQAAKKMAEREKEELSRRRSSAKQKKSMGGKWNLYPGSHLFLRGRHRHRGSDSLERSCELAGNGNLSGKRRAFCRRRLFLVFGGFRIT